MVQGLTKRRKTALEALENQLAGKTKPEKIDGKTTENRVELTDTDIERIKKQIAVLKSRI